MLRYGSKKTMKPLYDFYVETDLDTIDDQPIDFSKRYDDQLADDVCSSSRQKRHMSSPSVVPNKIPGDELKVYCIEGTPLIISSASSLCDLNDIGALIPATDTKPLRENTGDKSVCQESYSNNKGTDNDATKGNEMLQDEGFEKEQVENKEDSVEVVNTSGASGNFSKASSPLMFSRSSSICSLNSFEQHSIVDDRSSVSMFSNLASGIISPSEIPDSPGEAMSPFIPKRQSAFVFPPNDNHKSMDPILAKLKLDSEPPFIDESFEDVPEDNLKVFNDEGDCCSESNLSALSIQASSMSHVSVAVFHKNEFPDVVRKSSIRISCSIVTGNAELQSINEDVDASKKHAMHVMAPKENRVESSKSCVKDFSNYSVSDATDDESQDEKINYSSLNHEDDECKDEDDSPAENFDFEDDYEPCSNSFKNPLQVKTFIPENESPDFSKDISDDECDDLLKECIKKGMQGKTSIHQNSKQPLSTSCQDNQESDTKEEFQEENGSNSDCNTSDSEEDDELLQSCIQLGMPQKSSSPLHEEPVQSSTNNHQKPANSPDKSSQNFSKEMDDMSDEEYDPLLQHVIQMGQPENPNESCKKKPKDANSYVSDEIKLNFSKEMSELSDDGEYDPLLQQVIQLGQPKKPKDSCQKDPKDVNSYSSNGLKLGYRDNRPDGTSDDEDDDDDILNECIQAGMPKPKPENNHYQKQYAQLAKFIAINSQPFPQRTSSASQDRANFMSSFAEPHFKCFKSPTREDKTMHQTYKIYQLQQPIISPIDEDRIMPLPAHTRSHQRQPHRRSPTQEDRLNSFSGQCQPQPYKRSSTTGEHTKPMTTFNGQWQSQSHKRSPTTVEQTKSLATFSDQYQPLQHKRSPSTVEQTRSMTTFNGHWQSPSHRRSPTTIEQTRLQATFSGQGQSQSCRRSSTTVEQKKPLATYNGQFLPQTRRKSPSTETRSKILATFNRQCQPHRSPANVDRVASSNGGQRRKSPPTPERTRSQPAANTATKTSPGSESKAVYARKYFNWIHNSIFSRNQNISPATIPDDATCTYRTEDTPILSPSASASDLSTLSFSEDRMFVDGSLNNSLRNLDCSSDSEDDELLLQCIRLGMPSNKTVQA